MEINGGFEYTDKFEWFDKPYFWEKHNLTVIADRHLPDGTRQHIVRECIEDCVLDSAQIFSISKFNSIP